MKSGSSANFYDALYAGRSKQGTVNPRPTRDLALVNAAGFLRSFGVGLLGVVLGIYLSRVRLSSLEIGFVIAAGLAGSALATGAYIEVVTDKYVAPPMAMKLHESTKALYKS
jgi:hypothetical protein